MVLFSDIEELKVQRNKTPGKQEIEVDAIQENVDS